MHDGWAWKRKTSFCGCGITQGCGLLGKPSAPSERRSGRLPARWQRTMRKPCLRLCRATSEGQCDAVPTGSSIRWTGCTRRRSGGSAWDRASPENMPRRCSRSWPPRSSPSSSNAFASVCQPTSRRCFEPANGRGSHPPTCRTIPRTVRRPSRRFHARGPARRNPSPIRGTRWPMQGPSRARGPPMPSAWWRPPGPRALRGRTRRSPAHEAAGDAAERRCPWAGLPRLVYDFGA